MEGLPNDATEDDILDGFASASPDAKVFSPENVKVVRLRNNKRGRRIGFVEFFGVNDAAHFLEYHYPGLEFQLAHSRGVDSEPVGVGINYSRGRDDEGGLREDRGRDERARGDDKDWTCSEVRAVFEYALLDPEPRLTAMESVPTQTTARELVAIDVVRRNQVSFILSLFNLSQFRVVHSILLCFTSWSARCLLMLARPLFLFFLLYFCFLFPTMGIFEYIDR